MPIYEYQCGTCGSVTDIKHGFKEAVSEPCGACGSDRLTRLFNPAGIVFKGSGFYITDSRKSAESSSSKSESGAKSDSAGKADSGTKADSGKTESGGKTDSGAKTGSGGKGDAAA